MQVTSFVVVTVVVLLVIVGGCALIASQRGIYPATLRVQNDQPFTLIENEWTRMPDTTWITKGDGVRFEDGYFYFDKKYSGALFTINIEASDAVFVRFVGIGKYGEFPQELGMIDMLGSTLWQDQLINDYYTVELMANDETVVQMFRIGVQVNR